MLSLYNTKSRTKELFVPLAPPLVTMYNCGPTVYNYAHIGNLRGYVNADIIRRILEHYNLEVKQIINITDVGHLVGEAEDGEDKIQKGAERDKKSVEEIIAFYSDAFFDDLAALGINPSRIYHFPRATEHIAEQVELIKVLEKKGYTYTTPDGVYFNTSKYPEYGNFARLDMQHLQEGARVESNPHKKNPTDFALWKFRGETKRLQEWDSPWGVGFPGWHIECSAMAMKYLGETIDIHTGGIDHIPVHHTNEIAQSVCATGKEFARYWVHHEFIQMGTEKMAKSTEDFIRLETLINQGYSPFDYRYLLLQVHYRTPLSFSYESLRASRRARTRLIRQYAELDSSDSADVHEEYKETFLRALNDDVNTAEALALMWKLLKDDRVASPTKKATLVFFDSLLGLGLDEGLASRENDEIPEEIVVLAEERQKEKENGNYKKADSVRDEILRRGYVIKDTKEGFVIELRQF
ncbi:MAG: cysteine--tRNA ligase [Candidatus Paceibacterota bacterium]